MTANSKRQIIANQKKSEKEYWLNQLAGELGRVHLPYDTKDMLGEAKRETISFTFPQELNAKLLKMSNGSDQALHMILMTGLMTFVHRYTGANDFIIGTPIYRQAVEGELINTVLPLRGTLQAGVSFKELLLAVRQSIVQGSKHQDYPLDILARELGNSWADGESLFEIALLLENVHDRAYLASTPVNLLFAFNRQGDRLAGEIEYNASLYKKATIHRIQRHFSQLVIAALVDVNRKLVELEVLSDSEKEELLAGFNQTQAPYPETLKIHQLFEAQVAKTPDQIALVFGTESMTYREVNQRANQLARLLRAQGVTTDTFVGLIMERSLEMIIGMLAVLKAGGAYLPLDPHYPEERIKYIVEDSGTTLFLTQSSFSPLVEKYGEVICVEDQTLYTGDSSNLEEVGGPDQLAYAIYTSGSTGNPKGVLIEHRSVVNLLTGVYRAYPFIETDAYLLKTAYIFDVSVSELFGWFLGGGRLVILAPEAEKEPQKILDTIQRERVTHLNFVPSMFQAFVNALTESNLSQLESVKYIFFCGEVLLVELVEQFLRFEADIQLVNLYGPTEATVYASAFDLVDWDGKNPIPIGRPLPNLQMYILNSHRQLQPIGVTGELCIGGVGLARGYLNRAELTQDKFIDHPYRTGETIYRTGDLARWKADGTIEFLGRIDDQVKVRGYRIELGEVENQLLNYPQITGVAVVAKGGQLETNYLVAYYVATQEVTAVTLREYLGKTLPQYMIPAYFVQLETLPLLANGKINRKALPDPLEFFQQNTEYVAPRDEVEKELVQIWQENLGIKKIGVQDQFTVLGGDSLKGIEIVTQIYRQLDIEVPLQQIFELETIAQLAKYIQSAQKGEAGSQVRYPQKEMDRAALHQTFPLTDIQRAYLLGRSDDFEGGGVSTHIYMELEARLDLERLNQSLNRLIQYHPMLRAVILDSTRQQILAEVPKYQIETLDISELNQGEQEQVIRKERERMSHCIYQPDQWPLFEIKGFKIAADTHYLCIGIDLLIGDAASLQMINSQLLALYENPELELPELEFTFRDYLLAVEELKQTDFYQKDREYWLNQVDEFPLAPALPLKQDPAQIQQPRFKRYHKTFSQEEWAGIKAVAQKNGLTPSALLCTAYAEVLAYWSNQPELAINLTVFNRYPFHRDVNQIVGDFTSVILLGLNLEPQLNLYQQAKKVQSTLLEALQHRHYEGIEFMRDLARHHHLVNKAVMPIVFTSVLQTQAEAQPTTKASNLFERKMGITQTSQVFIDCQVGEREGELIVNWDYVEQLFDQAMIESMFEQYMMILDGLIQDEGKPQLLQPGQQDLARVEEYNRTDEAFDLQPLHQLFADQAGRTPELIAVEDQAGELTYQELDQRSNQVAHYLRQQGVGRNQRIGVVAERKISTVVYILGILKAGATYVPIDPEYPEDRKEYICDHSQCQLLITPDFFTTQQLEQYPTSSVENKTTLEDIAYIIYTSGSTGRPKGVVISHQAAANTIIDINRKFAVNEQDRIIGVSSFCFDLSVYDLFGALACGASLVLVPSQKDIPHLIETLDQKKITIWNSVPAIMDILVQTLPANYTNQLLRTVLLSGDWIPLSLPGKIQDKFFRAEVISLGGATEGSIWSIYYPIQQVETEWKSIPYGYPLANQKFYTLNYKMEITPVGIPGELYIGGLGVANGYLNDVEKTNVAFIQHPQLGRIYKTGDYGVLHPAGYIEFLGRRDHQVKIRGYRIELGEIESCLLENPGIANAVVIDRVDENQKKYLAAYFVAETELAEADLRAALAEKLPDYMIPAYFIQIEAIPLTSNGKVNRKALPEPELGGQGSSNYAPPRTDQEAKLVKIWQKVLKNQQIGIDDNFFELGGDSLVVQLLINQIEEEFGVKIPIAGIFKKQTIAELSEFIREFTQANKEVACVAVESEEKLYWSPVVHWEMTDKAVVIRDQEYSGVAMQLFPKLYFLSQKGITLAELNQEFANFDLAQVEQLIRELVTDQVLVSHLLTPQEVFSTQRPLYTNRYGEEILYISDQYEQFKADQLNRSYAKYQRTQVELQPGSTEWPKLITERRSHREFDQGQLISFEQFSKLLSIFAQQRTEDQLRYYYPSAGGLYAIDLFVYVKADRIEGVKEGLYFYNPLTNSLDLANEHPQITEDSHFFKNKSIFTSSAFSIFFIYNADVNMPMYNSNGYFYACIDTGIMVSTLTQAAELVDIGLCSIGDMNFDQIQDQFMLSPEQIWLHTVEGGLKLAETAKKSTEFSTPQEQAEKLYPVSSGQRRLFTLQQLYPESIQYNSPVVSVVEGELDLERLEAAFKKLVQRHEILRTSFRLQENEPMQQVHPNLEFEIKLIEAKEESVEGQINSLIRPFDLTQLPLFRMVVIRVSPEKQILFLDIHHIITDMTGGEILIKELLTLYLGQELPKMRVQFKDYALWQEKLLDQKELQEQEQYWLEQFAGEIPVLDLPTDYPRPSVLQYQGADLTVRLDAEQTKQLKALVSGQGATLYMGLLAAYNVLLARYSGQDDIVVGSPISGRRHVDFQNLIGMLANTLALRNQPSPDQSFSDFLDQVSGHALEAYDHQDYPFEKLIEKLNVDRDFSRNPLFDVMFVLQNMERGQRNYTDLKISKYEWENISSKFDLLLEAMEDQGEIILRFEYSTSLFTAETMRRMANHFINIIEAIIVDPEQKIGQIELLSAEEKQRLLVDFNETKADFPQEMTIPELFEEQVAQTPDQVAVIYQDHQLTYRELNERANQVAHLLREKGVLPDTIVGIMAERSLEMMVGLMGIIKAGGAYLPLQPDYPSDRIQFMLEDSQAGLLLTQAKWSTRLEKINFAGKVIELEGAEVANQPKESLTPVASPENLMYIIYTSGSTGRPKGVMIEHRSLVNRLNWGQKSYPIGQEDVILQKTPFVFDVSVWELFWWSLNGASLCFLAPGDEKRPEAIIDTIESAQVTTMHFVPSMLNVFLEYLDDGVDFKRLASLRQVFTSGEALGVHQMNRFHQSLTRENNTRIINLYGPTETTIEVSYYNCQPDEEWEQIPIGKPIDNNQFYVVDQQLQLQPIGVPGELCVAGVNLARGYLNRPELTQEKFVTNPFVAEGRLYRTGDLVKILPDGNVQFLGRIDNQIKIRGFRIELGEIENRLLELNFITEAIVQVFEEADGSKYLAAYLVSTEDFVTTELKRVLGSQLPEYMIPEYYIRLEKLPLTSNGKVNRKALPEPTREKAELISPRNPLERKLAQIWKEILGLEQVGIDTNFFQVGGQSLKAITLTGKIHKEFGREITMQQIFDTPTIRQLAELLSTGEEQRLMAIGQASEADHYPLSSAQKRLFVLNQLNGATTDYNMPSVLVIKGELEIEKLEQSFQQLISKHEALRTSFTTIEGQAVQIIHPEVEFAIHKIDHPFTLDRDEVSNLLSGFIQPFDLSQPPLIRVGLVVGDEQSLLLIDMHHIVSDAISMEIITRDFIAFYQDQPMRELTIQYKDFAIWQNQIHQTDFIRTQEEYWLNTFAGEVPVLDLPTDYPRPAVMGVEGDSFAFELDQLLTLKVREMAKEHDVTFYMIMLAAYNLVLAKYSGQDDIVVGTPIAGRHYHNIEDVVGVFINMLAMRNYPASNKTFIQLLKEVKENSLKAFANQDYQFDLLVEKLNLERNLSRNPLFDVMINLLPENKQEINIDGLQLSSYPFENKTAKYDLELMIAEQEEQVKFVLEYSTKLFKRATIARFAEHFVNVIRQVVEHPHDQLAEIDMLVEEERQYLLTELNDHQVPFCRELSIYQYIEQTAAAHPDRIAVIFEDEQVTYGQLNAEANQLARLLAEHGITTDQTVGVLLDRTPWMVKSILAIWKAGGAYIPIDPAYPVSRIQAIMDDSGSKLLITQSEHVADQLRVEYAEKLLELDQIGSKLQKQSTDNLNLDLDMHSLSYVIYTSGSTGRPKGAMVEHIGMMNHIFSKINELHLDEKSIIAQNASHCFDISVWQFFVGLVVGGRTVIYSNSISMDPERLIGRVRADQVTILEVVPSFLSVMLEYIEIQYWPLDQIQYLLVTGETLKLDLVARWFKMYPKIKLVNAYGPTEASDDITHFVMVETPQLDTIPIGQPIQNLNIYIVDDNMKLVPQGVKGEICVSGVGVGRGYLNDPERTKPVFMDDPFAEEKGVRLYKTGDLGRWLPDGNIEFFGRKDYQVKIRGFRIELGEIENKLVEHPDIRESVVIDKTGEDGTKYLCAYLVGSPDLDNSEIRAYLSESLPNYMVPAYLIQLDKMPLNANGKINRKVLPEPEVEHNSEVEYIQPTDEIQQILSQIWSEVLGVQQVGIKDNFFNIGGDSIKGIQIAARLQKHQLKLDIKDLFQHPTIEELAHHVQRISKIAEQGLITGQVKLTPIQKQFFDEIAVSQYNQAIMLQSPQGLDPEGIKKVFRKITEHHDALRAIYQVEGDQVSQINRGLEEEHFQLTTIDLTGVDDYIDKIRVEANRLQASLDLTSGPLIRLGLFQTDQGDHLLIVIHHLLIDGISWRILIEDILIGYEQVLNDQPITFQSKTDSYQKWAEVLHQYADSPELLNEVNYWATQEQIPLVPLPKDHPVAAGTYGESQEITVSLSTEDTEDLLRNVHQVFNTEINDLLLTGLALAVNDWSGLEQIPVTLEGHGREDENLPLEIDITRTVGWFTSIYPVILDATYADDLAHQIKVIKEDLRKVPNKGFGYGVLKYLTSSPKRAELKFDLNPEIIFNFLGQVDQEPGSELLKMSPLPTGTGRSSSLERKYAIEINSVVIEDRLNVIFNYHPLQYESSTVTKLADLYIAKLAELIRYCQQSTDTEYTPSDFGDYDLSLDELSKISAKINLLKD